MKNLPKTQAGSQAERDEAARAALSFNEAYERTELAKRILVANVERDGIPTTAGTAKNIVEQSLWLAQVFISADNALAIIYGDEPLPIGKHSRAISVDVFEREHGLGEDDDEEPGHQG